MRLAWLCAALLIALGACVVESGSSDDDGGGANGSGAGSGQTSGPSSGGAGGAGVGGTGIGGDLPPACEATVPRPTPPQAIIAPQGLLQTVTGLIGEAQDEVLLTMYQLYCDPCVDAMIAAHNRGVSVRVSLDPNQGSNNGARSALKAAGIEVRDTPSEFNHAHAKVLVIDSIKTLVMSANLNDYSLYGERNYGVIDTDPQDVAQVKAIFERDWNGSGPVDVSCTRLIVSPENARERILAHINSAQQNLDFAAMYISDDDVMDALKARAAAGVAVRVLLAAPEWIDSNYATAAELGQLGIPARYFYTYDLHAKLSIADGVALVGSQNYSWNSLENNREIGMLVTEPGPAGEISAQFEADWAQGYTP